jgi:hypothetical protein
MLLDLQRSAGNAAVVHLLRPWASTGAAALAAQGAVPVQRSLWGDDDEDTASDAQSGDGSGSESSWWDWGSGDGSSGSSDGGDAAASGDSGGSSASGSASGDSAGQGGASGGTESSWWDWGSSEPSEPAQGGGDQGGSSWWPFGGSEEGEPAQGGGDQGGSSWWPFGGDEEGEPEPGQEAPGGDEDTGGHTPEEIERKIAEGDGLTASDPLVPMGGGPAPVAGPGPHGFLDGGRRATIPFGDAATQPEDPAEAWHPRAFTGGGRTGTATWAGGGGAGKGPKGNQGSGSIQSEVVPKYDSHWNGPFSNADVWVVSGTGTADVHRDYVTSTAGDQGNGWWISAAAASALEAHERRHVTAARQVYEATVQPMLDRIAGSAATGKGKTYWASDGITVLSRFIGWEPALKEFKEQDAQWNAPNGQIDQEDYGSAGYPHNMKGPRTIGGKAYDNYLIMNSEPDPT